MVVLADLPSLINTIMSEFYSGSRGKEILFELSRHSRMQGGQGLVDAAEALARILKGNGLEVEIRKYPIAPGVKFQMFQAPIPWDVKEAHVNILQRKYRLEEVPTLVSLNSPSTSGTFEGQLVHVGPGDREEHYSGVKVEDRVILACGRAREVYRLAARHGASGVIFYRRWGVREAVPYTGLWLREKPQDGPFAVNIPRSLAERAISKLEKGEQVKVEAYVESEFHENGYLPVVTATVGDGDLEVWLTGHLCHPAPGAHDNASGVAATAEALIALKHAVEAGRIDMPRITIRGVWGPEYMGFIPFVEEFNVGNVIAGINMDMVAGKQELLGGTVHVIRTLNLNFSPINMLVEEAFSRQFKGAPSPEFTFGPPSGLREKIDYTGYSPGSDHDVLNSYGIPSVMILEWPDQYYHSHLDHPDNISSEMMKLEGSAVAGVAAYLASLDDEESEKFAGRLYHYIKSYYHAMMLEASHGHTQQHMLSYSSRARHLPRTLPSAYESMAAVIGVEKANTYRERLERELSSEAALTPKHAIPGDPERLNTTYKATFRGPFSMRALEEGLDSEGYRRFSDLVNKRLKGTKPLHVIYCIFSRPTRLVEALEMLSAEVVGVDLEAALEAMDYLVKAGVLEKV